MIEVILNSILTLIAIIIFFQSAFLLLEAFLGVKRLQDRNHINSSSAAGVKILIPAHNEALVIESTLKSLANASISTDDILVVADNCEDNTAELARNFGVVVSEREDRVHRGKGHALAHGINQLRADPPQYVLILDADCSIQEGAIEGLIESSRGIHPVQSNYLIKAGPNAGLSTRISAFLFKIKNLVRTRAISHLGCSSPLLGSGMLFPWEIASNVHFDTSSIVEDTKIGLDLQLSGTKIIFSSTDNVESYFPETESARSSQSTRWEQGSLELAFEYVPKLIQSAVKKGDFRLLLSALNLSIPPLSLLIFAIVGLSVATGLSSLLTGYTPPLLLSLASLTSMLLFVLICWYFEGREELAPSDIFYHLPLLTLKKIPHYFQLLQFKRLDWVKTERDE